MKSGRRKQLLLDCVRGSFIGAAIGDAMGMPVESMKRPEILAATGGKGVTGYIAPLQTKIKDTIGLLPGSTTDDTQLMLAVARSLARVGRFRLQDQAKMLISEYDSKLFGWGGTTMRAAEELKLWYESKGKQGRDPSEMALPPKRTGEGLGTGVAMKVAPLAIFVALSEGMDGNAFIVDVIDLGLQTHGDPRASYAALAVAGAIAPAVWKRMPSCAQDIRLNGGAIKTASFFTTTLVENAELRCKDFRRKGEAFSKKLALARQNNGSLESLLGAVGAGYSSMQAVPLAMGIFFRHPTDFRRGVLEAVNAGGDTDTTASMVGAMIGAHVGVSGIPAEWIRDLRDADKVFKAADRLVKAALQKAARKKAALAK